MPHLLGQMNLLLHGIGVEMAEALAEHWHHRIREEWGFADEDGPSFYRVGKKAAGRELDGVIHDGYPLPEVAWLGA